MQTIPSTAIVNLSVIQPPIMVSIAIISVARHLRQRKSDFAAVTGLMQEAAPEALIDCPAYRLSKGIGELRLFHQEESSTTPT